jgi:hypothetical protein
MNKHDQVADKYVSRGGRGQGRYHHEDVTNDLITLGSFLAWQDDDELSGGVWAKDAWAAMCRLLDLHPVELRKVFREGRG